MKGTLRYPTLLGLAALLLVSTPGTALSYGEGAADLPSLEERATHLFTDRLRVEPDATDADFSNYPAVAPLIYNADLAEAARFHADDMAINDCFQHESCDGTSFGERLQRYYNGFGWGENIALGSPDAETVVFDGWLYSPPHRDNMLSGDWRELGTGFAQVDGSPRLWVQDFGFRGGEVEPITTSATHWPLRPSAEQEISFFLAAYDPDGAPQSAELIWQDSRQLMEHDRGSDGMQTWALQVPAATQGCLPYYFALTRGDGSEVIYPTSGALIVPVGTDECEIWTAARPVEEGQGCASSTSGGYSGTGNAGCGSDPEQAGGPDDNIEGDTSYSTCALAPQPRPATWAVLAVVFLQLRRRRR